MSTTPTTIDFISYRRPSLDSGEYRVTIDQTLIEDSKIGTQNYGIIQNFYVAGERFHILPEHIKSAFPPPHSLGEHSNVFPHLMLSRNTLPWERESVPNDTETPWLALLVIHDSEADRVTESIVTLGDLETGSADPDPFFPALSLEPGQDTSDKVKVLDIEQELLETILPTQEALNFLTHIRQGKDSYGNLAGEDLAVVIANRLPQDGAVNTIYLVSLENRYDEYNNNNGTYEFNYQGAGATDKIRLVSLYRWEFTSTEHFKVSEVRIDHAVSTYKLSRKMIDKLSVSDTIKNNLKADTDGALVDEEFPAESDFTTALTNLLGPLSTSDTDEILYHAHLSTTITDTLRQSLIGEEFFTVSDFNTRLDVVFDNALDELDHHRDKIHEVFAFGDFATVLSHLDRTTETLRLPNLTSDPENINPYLQSGFYPLPHKLRGGSQTVSWYHGPLSPVSNTEGLISNTANNSDITDAVILYDDLEWTVSLDTTAGDNTTRTIELARSEEPVKTIVINLSDNSVTVDGVDISDPDQEIRVWKDNISFPAEGSDALLRYYQSISMFDVSYASAWELGRLLALQNTKFSTELYQWKRRYAKATAKQNQIVDDDTAHLRGGNRDHTTEALPTTVSEWLDDLKLLKGIPFNYLVPDEELLPAESIRFFQVDELWVKSLLDGAFSIGRVTSSDHALDDAIAASETALTPTLVSGFILRSEAVSGWPGMQIEGYSDAAATSEIPLSRQDYLSNNVMLCLFEGDLQVLDLHLKPEMLHFGVRLKTDDSGDYEKILRDNNGAEDETYTVDVPLSDGTLQLADYTDTNDNPQTGLLSNIRTARDSAAGASPPVTIEWPASAANESSADLALQLIEGVERVRFTTASS